MTPLKDNRVKEPMTNQSSLKNLLGTIKMKVVRECLIYGSEHDHGEICPAFVKATVLEKYKQSLIKWLEGEKKDSVFLPNESEYGLNDAATRLVSMYKIQSISENRTKVE